MTVKLETVNEENLDPKDWLQTTKLGKQMVEDMMQYLKTVRERKIWQPIPTEVREEFRRSLPLDGMSQQEIYDDFKKHILPYPMGNIHPRFWGWVIGTGTPFGALADFLASIMNPNQGGGEHIANHIETQVLDWFKEMLGYPSDASGILLSGGSMANLLGMTVARNTKIESVRETGLIETGKQFTYYSSVEAHSSVVKAAELLGIGSKYLRKIPVDENFEIIISKLEEQIKQDKENGMIPLCIVGNAGTVNTGAVDDLNAIADICERENLWFHVDGAFGSLVHLSEKYKSMVKGMERSDSLAFDAHKWLFMPYEIAVTLVKDRKAHYQAFVYTPEYLAHADRGVHSADLWYSDYGLQLSRGFRSLKVWMSLKEHGIKKYGRLIEQNINQAKYLENIINNNDRLENMAPVPMNIVCFRMNPGDRDQVALNKLNEEILIELHERGIAVPSYTTLNNNYLIRVAITNHRSELSDFDLLVASVLEIGDELISSGM
ncbi:MAG: aminotransferase class V-fold PLP-dependent enzyme [Candidatus Heimdallarchaeota archaeon]|nr:aminotransferase class V-fold PLP-dependent enzyme [Candidatus Heimdallarchaeota archaeon]